MLRSVDRKMGRVRYCLSGKGWRIDSRQAASLMPALVRRYRIRQAYQCERTFVLRNGHSVPHLNIMTLKICNLN
jgi:hypothetical protein